MKNKFHYVIFFGIFLSVFTLFGCGGGAGGGTVEVTFNVNGSIKRITIPSGQSISDIDEDNLPSTDISYNYFMHWSASKASKADAVDFGVNTPITENTTLYAIFKPKLASSAITSLNAKKIEIKLYDPHVYPLEDGSYAGLTIYHSTNGQDWEDSNLNVPASFRDTGDNGYRYLTYNLSLSTGTHYFKVTNGISLQDHTTYVTITVAASDLRTVKIYNKDGTLYREVDIQTGTVLSSNFPSTSDSYNYFLYWSKSRATKAAAAAGQFDILSAVTEDMSLYPIYTPRLSSTAISELTSTNIVVALYDPHVYPLNDGSYAGLSIQYSTDGTTYQDTNLSVPTSFRDTSSSGTRYLTYTFDNQLSVGTHYYKVTNGTQTGYRSLQLVTPTPATNLSAQVNDSYAKISFTPAEGYSSYAVSVYSTGVSPLVTKSVTTSGNSGYAEFFGLQNGTEYTFKVVTGSSNQSAEVTATPQIVKKETDWVVALYMDGDNNLHQSIFKDMNEVENGLYQIRSSDGSTALSSYDSVNVVALWDGITSYQQTNSDGTTTTVTPSYGGAGTYLYELGTDSSNNTTLSSNTKNLSYTASWLVPTKTVSATQPTSYGELNMGDKQTLINYLNWVKAHYTANKGIILQFSNHGGGPRSATYIETADGTQLELGNNEERRALCWDETSGDEFLTTKAVSEAFTSAGFNSSNKLGMIIMDVCLGSSLEDAYQFRNYAQYFAASPNNIPGSGLDYYRFMQSFTKNTTLDAIGKKMVADYKAQYHTDARWNYYTQQGNFTNPTTQTAITLYSNLGDNQKYSLDWYSHVGITTFTITDLSKVYNVRTAIDSLCDVLLSSEGKAKKIKLDQYGYISPTTTSNEADYVKYLVRYANVEKIFGLNTSNTTRYYVDDSIFYQGTYSWLYDIGYIADMMKYCSTSTINGTSNVNAWPELYDAANAVTTALSQAVKYSWRDSKRVSSSYNHDFYCTLDNSSVDYQHYYGLSISGAQFATTDTGLAQGKAPDFYKTALAFGADSKWYDLLKYWFGE